MIPVTGQRLGPYEILGRLGSGGMGLVFSAWDDRLHRDVAIKLLRQEFNNDENRERFLMEARAASALNHPNICTVFDIGEHGGNPYLVMELLKGETLRGHIAAGPMLPAEVLRAGLDIAGALTAAHGRGIIHRDIKPANVFLVAKPGGWQCKVLDFGLAKIGLGEDTQTHRQITEHGSTVGTVAYMSPEQARGENLDPRSDLFALGIVLYEMATGKVPFDGVTSALIFVKLLGEQPETVRQLQPNFPKDLERIILKLLAKDRSARFQSATELCDALGKVELEKSGLLRAPRFSKLFPSSPGKMDEKQQPVAELFPVTPDAESPEAQATQDSVAARRPSEESVVIHPIRHQPLPPNEPPSSPGYWTETTPDIALPRTADRESSASRAPTGRPATFGFSVQNAYREEDPSPGAPGLRRTRSQPAPHARRWLRWTIAGLLLLAVALGGSVIWKRNKHSHMARNTETAR